MVNPLPRVVSTALLPLFSVIPSEKDLISSIHPSISWMDPIITYLRNGTLLEDRKEAERIRCRSLRFGCPEKRSCIKGHFESLFVVPALRGS